MLEFASASTRLVTDVTQAKSRLYLWTVKMGGTVPMLGKDRHLARLAIREALDLHGFSPSVMERLEWMPRSPTCFHPHYQIQTENPLRINGHKVDLHVRMK